MKQKPNTNTHITTKISKKNQFHHYLLQKQANFLLKTLFPKLIRPVSLILTFNEYYIILNFLQIKFFPKNIFTISIITILLNYMTK